MSAEEGEEKVAEVSMFNENSRRYVDIGNKIILGLSGLNCFYRADVNFPLALFAIILLKRFEGHFPRVFALYMVTSFTDLVYILMWTSVHSSLDHSLISHKETIIFSTSTILSCAALVVKVILSAYIAYQSPTIQYLLTPDGITETITEIFKGGAREIEE